MEPGIYPDLPEDIYHASDGASVSTLKTFALAPAKAKHGVRKETKEMALGSLVHCAVLEPNQLELRYKPTTLERRGTKAWDAEEAAAAPCELVKMADWDQARAMRDAAHRHPVGRDLLAPGCLTEQSFYWIDPETGLLCRGRADGMRPEMRVAFDVKSVECAHPDEFARKVADYHWHWQNAYYVDGLAATPGGWMPEAFIFLALEKEPPYLVGAYEIDSHHVDRGRQSLRALLPAYAECLRTDTWPGYSEALEILQLPHWAA